MGNLLTRDEIANILGIDDATVIPPAIVTWGENEVEKIVGKNYTAVTGTEKVFFLTNSRLNYLEMPFYDNMSITSIKYHVEDVDDVVPDVDEWVTIEDTDYYLEVDTAIIFFDYCLSRRVKYKVTFSYGGSEVVYLEKKLHLLKVLNYLQKFESDILKDASGRGPIKSEVTGDYKVSFAVDNSSESMTRAESEIAALVALLGGSEGRNDVGMV